MYYRRKVVLALIQMFEGRLDRLRLQKLTFLFSGLQTKQVYDFIPYKYGCYSYSLQADLNVMVKTNMLSEAGDIYVKSDDVDYSLQLKPVDQQVLQNIYSSYGAMSGRELMKYTYQNFPFYATRSEVAEDLLSATELKQVQDSRVRSSDTTLFTIGYEGISIEAYLELLIRHNVRLLVDVRNSPLSMKFGFSKTLLRRYCESVDIAYIHIPQLGIESTKRQSLDTQADYDSLFREYRRVNISKTIEHQESVVELLEKYNRVALTCFEANICQCHRKPLAEAISSLTENKIPIIHISHAPKKSTADSGHLSAAIQKL